MKLILNKTFKQQGAKAPKKPEPLKIRVITEGEDPVSQSIEPAPEKSQEQKKAKVLTKPKPPEIRTVSFR